jgi:hypothetical protein
MLQDEICLKMKFVIAVIKFKFSKMINDGAKQDLSSGGLGRSRGVSP